jgi:predicted RNA-binding Zn ribbon-like protein
MTARIVEKTVVRRGGRPAPRAFLFEVTGGELCLDLANTIDCRPTESPKERLGSYADLVSWGEQAGALCGAEARRLAAAARRRPAAAVAVLRRARILREALFAIFSAVSRSNVPPEADLEMLNDELGRAMAKARITVGQGNSSNRTRSVRSRPVRYRYGWGGTGGDLDRVLWPVARSATDLLTGDLLIRVRECDAGNCAWLFLDTSRNRSRRWCDMTVCGNREKAHRHYRRVRKST